MGPSAVQARAARDQAGRGALLPSRDQKKPDEGLFARPETAQPELAPQPMASRWPQAGFRDMLSEVPPTTPETVHQEAANWVFDKGRATGHEHLAVIENATGRIVHAGTSGRSNSVSFGADLGNQQDAYTVHHNHPSSGALSAPDIGMLTHAGISRAVAIGHSGDVFHAGIGDPLKGSRAAHPMTVQAELLRNVALADRISARLSAGPNGLASD